MSASDLNSMLAEVEQIPDATADDWSTVDRFLISHAPDLRAAFGLAPNLEAIRGDVA